MVEKMRMGGPLTTGQALTVRQKGNWGETPDASFNLDPTVSIF